MGTTGRPDRRRTRDTYRQVIALTGPLLPCVSFLGRLPTATVQFGSVLLVARTSGSLSAAGLTGGALALGQVVCGPVVGRLADRHGQRRVVLAFSLANALAVASLVAGALAALPTAVLTLLGAAAGGTMPLVGPLARARLVALARRSGAPESTVGAALSVESTLDEMSFVLGPALVGLASVLAHPAYAMAGAALLVAVCGTAFALHPTALTIAPAPENQHPAHAPAGTEPPEDRASARLPDAPASEDSAPTRARAAAAAEAGARERARVPAAAVTALAPMPRCVHALRASLALQGAMFGACQAGITALTARLGQEEQAGLVYAAMGVTSAAAGLAMAAVPARFGLPARRRLATAAAFVLSLPLLRTHGLAGLYAVVTVLGVAYAPHLITVFGLTERAVPPARLAEAMAFATSALVGGQALSVAVTGRLTDSYGPRAAFAVASTAAALTFVIALTARPTAHSGRAAPAPHARVDDDPTESFRRG
ncbi:MFS transporter [Streptomyces camelliae]|uniref:MFS transporter n=1 Tax=Streptomyces camelliae TaxID=3004093 RepID=A0ABY7P018_9ACTN|nr:MFS transporter [Streptomyces sp. HUAS 2-6]WBO63102.1 MFS transporter [Streptomyces sp. HUAS 2-6]